MPKVIQCYDARCHALALHFLQGHDPDDAAEAALAHHIQVAAEEWLCAYEHRVEQEAADARTSATGPAPRAGPAPPPMRAPPMTDPTSEDWHAEVRDTDEGVQVDIVILDGDVDDDGRSIVSVSSVLEAGYLVDTMEIATARKVGAVPRRRAHPLPAGGAAVGRCRPRVLGEARLHRAEVAGDGLRRAVQSRITKPELDWTMKLYVVGDMVFSDGLDVIATFDRNLLPTMRDTAEQLLMAGAQPTEWELRERLIEQQDRITALEEQLADRNAAIRDQQDTIAHLQRQLNDTLDRVSELRRGLGRATQALRC